MFYILVFLASWIAFLIFGNKKRFRELYTNSLIAMIMSLTSDVIASIYPFWFYNDPKTHIPKLIVELLDDFGIYPVIAYLYVQFLPETLRKWFLYTFLWTTGGILTEYFMIRNEYIVYKLGWSLSWSYVSNWIIFGILTGHHVWSSKKQMKITA
ncbi:hypothetical protein LSG31_19305 [Fodinisporobacter ferrooxydans]|uniref:Uncharacterized protein n=1 Tax=Fodinisporobacter ferrooxydans TaxID=2901836 RepID=A0ABY4CHP6_9BACL|nr:hypothetical protein LSG31_19305 [Alicyclobacillaceae bacterium MYW30-H2]